VPYLNTLYSSSLASLLSPSVEEDSVAVLSVEAASEEESSVVEEDPPQAARLMTIARAITSANSFFIFILLFA
jgi:hypothetical protein